MPKTFAPLAASAAMFLRQVGNCPGGRLVARDKDEGNPVEPKLPVSIGLIEDPAQRCSGPIWLRGGIAVESADGFDYDGTHAAINSGRDSASERSGPRAPEVP
jgi:hypothetical protein